MEFTAKQTPPHLPFSYVGEGHEDKNQIVGFPKLRVLRVFVVKLVWCSSQVRLSRD
jgi:hypothetical protein